MDPGTGTINGTVRDTTGLPIAGAVVVLGNVHWGIEAATDEDGRFQLDVPCGGPEWLTASARGFLPLRHRIDVRLGDVIEAALVLQPGGGTLAGLITDDRDVPLPGIQVSFLHPEFKDLSRQACRTEADEAGRFRFDGVPEGICRVTVADPFRGWTPDQQAPAGTKDLRFRMAGAGVVEGRVLLPPGVARHESSPLGSVVLTAEGEPGHERAHGLREPEFRFERLEPGFYSLQARIPGGGAGRAGPFEVRSGQITRVTVGLEQGECLRGRVLAEEGEDPVPGALVVAIEERMGINSAVFLSEEAADDFGGARGRTDEDGSFKVQGLTRGMHRLGVSAPGFVPVLYSGVPVPQAAEVRFALAPAGALRVRVLGSDGTCRSQCALTLHHPNRASSPMREPAAGETVFESLPTGQYLITVETEECDLLCRVVVRAGESTNPGVRIPELPCRLSGRLTGISEQERPLYVQVRHEDPEGTKFSFLAEVDRSSTFHFECLPRGPVRVVPVYRERMFWKEPGVEMLLATDDNRVEVPVVKAVATVLDDETGLPLSPPGNAAGDLTILGGEIAFADVVLTAETVDDPHYHPARLLGLVAGEHRVVRFKRALDTWIAALGPGDRILPGATIHVMDGEGWRVSDFARSRYQNPPPMVEPGLFRLAAGNYTVRVEHPDFDAHEEGIVVERNGACFEMRLSAPQEPEHDPR